MQKTFQYDSYVHNLGSVEDVIAAMEHLEQELKQTDLHNLIAFNHTYLIITKAVASQLGKNYFNDDEQMQKLDIQFSKYYFDALKNYVDDKACPPAWKFLFDKAKKNDTFQFIYMALGVNAHVNNDLAFTLCDIIKDNSYKEDYDKVNDVIKESIKDVVLFLEEDSKFLNGLKNSFRIIYSFILNAIIIRWRKRAWDNFTALKAKEIKSEKIETDAYDTAVKLIHLKSYLLYQI